jgi:signal transduction histidine kinase
MSDQGRRHPLFLQASAWQAALETALFSLLLVFGLTALKGLGATVLQVYGFLIIAPGGGLWCALRLRLPQGTRKQIIWQEFKVSVLLSLALGIIVWIPAALSGRAALLGEELIPVSVILSAPIFLLFRLGLRLWRYWDRLRREYMTWSMTSSILVAVYLSTLISVPFLVVAIVSESAPPDTNLVNLLLSQLIPSAGGMIVIFAIVEVLVILPPALLLSYLVARRITRRLKNLAKATIALRAGDYAMRVPVSGEDEVARLQANFNAMATDLQLSRQALQAERDKVIGLLKAQREMTISVSHELRTPVALIQGYLEPIMQRIGEAPSSDLQADLLVIEREVSRLSRLINDLFILSQSEVSRLVMQPKLTDVREVVEAMVDTFSRLAWQRSRVEIVTDADSQLPLAFVDAGRLEQILANLLRNGIRHTPPGGIIAILLTADTNQVKIELRDTGEGISPENLAHIWERFYRVQDSHASEDDGVGLGLAVVKELTEAMGGKVSVESTPGQGTGFTLLFPTEQPGED